VPSPNDDGKGILPADLFIGLTDDERAEVEAAQKEELEAAGVIDEEVDAAEKAAKDEDEATAKAAAEATAKAEADKVAAEAAEAAAKTKAEADAKAAETAATEAQRKQLVDAAVEAGVKSAEAAAKAMKAKDDAPPPRDHAKEMAELEEVFGKGELELPAYLAKRDAITADRIQAQLLVTLAEQDRARRAESAKAAQADVDSRWNAATQRFLAGDGNARFAPNTVLGGAMQAALGKVGEAEPTLDFDQMFAKAKAVVLESLGEKPTDEAAKAAAAKAAIEKATSERKVEINPVKELGSAPAAGSELGKTLAEKLDGLSALALEKAVAKLSPEQQEAYLRGGE
jgi:hypothetical protein